MHANGSERVKFAPFEADLRTRELWKDGARVKLLGQPFEVLAMLPAKPGELVTREELRARLWPGDTLVDFNHGLNAAVNKLREALGDSAENPRYIETLPRRGYRFVAPLEVANRAERQDVPEPDRVKTNRHRIELRHYFMAGVLLAFVLGITSLSIVTGKFLPKPQEESHLALARVRPLTGLPDETSQPAFSSDGNRVAFRREGAKPESQGIFVDKVGSDRVTQLTSNAGDCCPVWSPDGRSIAFSRRTGNDFSISMVPSGGGQERQVDTRGLIPGRGEIDWSPDGKTISFSAETNIFLLSLGDGAIRRLTTPPPPFEDWGPTFSPDGAQVLFVRSSQTGFPEEIMSTSTMGGEVTQITSEHARILGPPKWSFDGRSVIFASDRDSHPALWRVSVGVKEAPVEINDGGWHPAISLRGDRLAYERIVRNLSIWQMDFAGPDRQHPRILVASASETDQGPGPQFSPDGTKLAFMSDRSGQMEIWVSDRDGSNSFQLTEVGGAGTPRWSPDSRSIVFDAEARNGEAIYVVDMATRALRRVTKGIVPSWSRDGKWIYFASHSSGDWQVWKIPATGGSPLKVTTHGGHAALESANGKNVYYAKTQYANPEIWEVSLENGTEKLVSPFIRPFTWASWSVIDKGILFAGPSGNGKPLVSLFDFASHRITNLGTLDVVPFWLGATRDGKAVVFDQPGWRQAQIMLAENFR